jgi:polyphosphate kinase 2 (PPK2 family)
MNRHGRLEGRIDDPRKIWKLSDMDLKSYARWDDYSRARDELFAASDTLPPRKASRRVLAQVRARGTNR